MKLAIVGCRKYTNFNEVLLRAMKFLNTATHIVSGGATGVDTIAKEIASKYNLPLIEHQANWSEGRHAGMKRNNLIVEDADVILAFPSRHSKGTYDTIKKGRRAGKEVHVFDI